MPNKSYTITSPSWDGSLNTKFVDVISPTTSFSGTDIVVAFAFDDSRAVVVGTLATMTYSLYREKRQVRTLGRISPRGVTKGPMTVAGTLIFSVINQHVVNDIRQEIYRINPAHPLCATGLKRIRMDELPPFDIILTFGNEYGQSAKMVIYGVTITDEAMTFSIEDMFTENVMTYMARDIETMRGPFSPDMSMYIQGGTALGGGTQLPKYGFDSDNLWNKTLDSYKQRVKDLVDKANRDYGSSYNAPDYSGMVNLSPGVNDTKDDSVRISVHTQYTTGSPAPYVSVAFHSSVLNTSYKTDDSGNAVFVVSQQDAASFKLVAQFLPNLVFQVSNLESQHATEDASYTILLQSSHIVGGGSVEDPGPYPTAGAVVTTVDVRERIYESFVSAKNTVLKDVRWALSKAGYSLNDLVHTILKGCHGAIDAAMPVLQKGKEYAGEAAHAVKDFIHDHWKAILIGAGITAAIVLTIMTGGLDLIIGAAIEGCTVAFEALAGFFAEGGIFAAAAA